jgi:hypothetical protein
MIFQLSELDTRLNNWSLVPDFLEDFEQCQKQSRVEDVQFCF